MTVDKAIDHFETMNGIDIYRIPLEVFPDYIAYSHLIRVEGRNTLVDVGSGFEPSHQDLLNGLSAVQNEYGVPAAIDGIHRVIITHGHIDHFGGLSKVIEMNPAIEVASHDLVRPVLVNYDERVMITRKSMQDFIHRAGIPVDRQSRLMDMYMIGKQGYRSVAVNRSLQDGDKVDDLLHITHVPGHAPGLIMIQVDNILLTSDHILPETSVALAPESLTAYTGVGHYIESLEKAQKVQGVDMALGGHEWPMHDYYAMTRQTYRAALDKVDRVLSQCQEPHNIYQIAHQIYTNMDGYGELLKLWQTGARIEYLNQRGLVMIENLDDLEREENPVLCYRKV